MACEHFTPSALCQGCTWCAMRAGIEQGEERTKALLTDALDFIADNEWGGGETGACLDCGAPRDSQHSENCRWLAVMRRGGRKS